MAGGATMDWKTWTLFVLLEGTLSLTPGPAVLFVLSQGLRRGGAASIWANLGILAGNLIYFALSATGVGAVLAGSERLFTAIKWIGAAYLLWLGVSAWIGKAKPLTVKAESGPVRSGPATLVHGLVMQLANPKALVFFTAFLPQFIDPGRPLLRQFAILAATSAVLEFFILLGYGVLAGQAARLAAEPAYARILDRTAGAMLIVAGLMVAAITRA
jgi:homoserine/homoserine lactone efflux protein